MILNEKQQLEFKEAAEPLVKFLQKNCHPHCKVIVENAHAELVEGLVGQPYEWKDLT